MIFEKDWLARQIELTLNMIANLLFQTQEIDYRSTGEHPTADALHAKLLRLVEEGDPGGGEDVLFDALDEGGTELLPAAADFYHRLNRWTDEALIEHDFSREEVRGGLDDVLERLGYDPAVFHWERSEERSE